MGIKETYYACMGAQSTVLCHTITVLVIAAVSIGCHSTPVTTTSVTSYDPQLFDLEGKQIAATSISLPGQVLFFSCGCSQCRDAAKDLRSVSQGMACVGNIESKDLRAFVREVGWGGPVYVDPGGSFGIKHQIASCPRFLKMDGGTWREVQLTELVADNKAVPR